MAGLDGEKPIFRIGGMNSKEPPAVPRATATLSADGDRLVDCFTAINQAFQTIRNDPEATLFGFDQYGHVFIHQTTHDSIRQLWQHLFAAHAPMTGGPAAAAGGPALAGFTPPRLGPSEDVAQHASGPASVNF